MNQATRDRVVSVAREWLGTPWHHGSRVRGGGVDCAQLLIAVYSEAGVLDAFDPGEYAIDGMLHTTQETFIGWCDKFGTRTDNPAPGDTVLWKVGRWYSHGGIVLDWPLVLHAFRPFGEVCITPYNASLLSDKPMVFYTFT